MNFETTYKLGSHTPIFSLRLKGWLFQQSWLTSNPDTQRHPLRWTNNSKGACCAQEYRRGGFTNDIAI